MGQQDKQVPDNQQSAIEDLTINEEQAAVVKGGIAFVGGWGSSSYQYAFEGTHANSQVSATEVKQKI